MLEDLPKTVSEFEAKFGTEVQCEEYLRRKRWPEGFVCPRCGGRRSWKLKARALDECASCHHQVSLTAGTIFENTQKPLVVWFRVIAQFVLAKSGCSAMDIHRQHGLSYQTSWTWLHKVRSTMDRVGAPKLSGRVEVDETFEGGEDDAAHKGRCVTGKKTPVVVAVETKGARCGRARIEFTGGTGVAELEPVVERNVEKGSTLVTDGLQPYQTIAKKGGFKHDRRVIGKSKKNASKLLRHVHLVISLLHRLLLGTYQGACDVTHLKRYLDEFVFRFNRRTSRNRYHLFDRVFDAICSRPPTYAELVGRQPLQVGAT